MASLVAAFSAEGLSVGEIFRSGTKGEIRLVITSVSPAFEYVMELRCSPERRARTLEALQSRYELEVTPWEEDTNHWVGHVRMKQVSQLRNLPTYEVLLPTFTSMDRAYAHVTNGQVTMRVVTSMSLDALNALCSNFAETPLGKREDVMVKTVDENVVPEGWASLTAAMERQAQA